VGFQIRVATPADVDALTALIGRSVRGLQSNDYTPSQIDCAIATVYGVDSQLIADGTYFVVESGTTIVACGGWSKRKTLCGGDRCAWGREDSLLDTAGHAAKIRAFFVEPEWARRGIGSLLLETCENHAITAGFTRLEMGSTLTGVALYSARGYVEIEKIDLPMANGEVLPIARMEKTVRARENSATESATAHCVS
jgi:GNAT superfamily N-acetyltransferase